MKQIPFAGEIDGIPNYDGTVELRAKKLVEFMRLNGNLGMIFGPVLDIGSKNRVGDAVQNLTGHRVYNTVPFDLNTLVVPENVSLLYRTVCCTEVLEHVMCPLGLLRDIWEGMHPGGLLFLSTPLPNIFSWYQGDHFAEYKQKQLEKLFVYAGFRVEAYTTYRMFPFKMVNGIRPFFRWLFFKTQMYQLRKI